MRTIILALADAGYRFEVGPERVKAFWTLDSDPLAASIDGVPVTDYVDTLIGTTSRQFAEAVLGADLCLPRLVASADKPRDMETHGSSLPFGLCAIADFVLPCSVLCRWQSFSEWEAEYRAARPDLNLPEAAEPALF